MTTNDTWSFTGSEGHYKTIPQLLTMFTECLSMGGNMLLNVGPDEHGTIPDQQVALLQAMGAWIARNEAAVYQTLRGLPHGYSYHGTSMNANRDTLFLYLAHVPAGDATATLKGICNEVRAISVLGSQCPCDFHRIGGAPWLNVPGTLWIDVPADGRDPDLTVLKIELDGPLDLHNGHGVEIDQN